ncbi:MAG: Nif3-like dinuclear metal center hexameric protein [Erysipelotrichaceae bacterium]|nr:Nif3-like dinuclear metal center hexameric protein [Erysipelotrichaceae bacterium]
MKISTIVDHLEQYFPFAIQETWDRSGLQIGNLDGEANKVMVSLNCDLTAVEKAIENGCELLVTHHPFLLNKFDNYDTGTAYTRILEKALKHNLTVVSFHTCLDRGIIGVSMNYWLISKLPVGEIKNYDETGIGKMAILDNEYDFDGFVELAKNRFGLETVRTNELSGKKIRSVAICGGSGFDDINKLFGKVDCFISGDCKYHQGQVATENNLAVIDASHHLEVIMELEVAKMLSCFELEIITAGCTDYLQVK